MTCAGGRMRLTTSAAILLASERANPLLWALGGRNGAAAGYL